MRTATYKVDVASDRRRRENVPRHILCSIIYYCFLLPASSVHEPSVEVRTE